MPACERCAKMPGRQCRRCALDASADHFHDIFDAEVARQLYHGDVAHHSAASLSPAADTVREAAQRCGWRAVASAARDMER